MITGELKNKIDALWDVFAAGGIVNPLTVVEQMTYLMFIRDLDDADNLKAKEAAMLGLPYESIFAEEIEIGGNKVNGTQLKWSVFRDFPAGKMYSVVQSGSSRSSKTCTATRTVRMRNTWTMRSS